MNKQKEKVKQFLAEFRNKQKEMPHNLPVEKPKRIKVLPGQISIFDILTSN